LPTAFQPLVEPLTGEHEAEDVFRRLARQPHCLFLDSAMLDPSLGRYSFVTCDPVAWLRAMPGDADALAHLPNMLATCPTARRDDLPPFQGGVAGLFSYDLGRQYEPTRSALAPRLDEFGVPAVAVGLYDVVIAFDHQIRQAWIISQGLPETEPLARRRRAADRLAQFRHWLAEPPCAPSGTTASSSSSAPLPADRLAPQFPAITCHGHPARADALLTSNFSEPNFLRAVQRAIEYIYAGDVFQVNLSQRLLHPAVDDPVSLYLRLRRRNPAPMAGYFDLGDFQIASASPERFLQVRGRLVETRPIKGTRPRYEDEAADQAARDELCRSQKDRAENVMIVDLLRNDLSRVCEPDSVRVRDLCRLESYRFVHHLVSTVEGRLAEPAGPLELLAAAFPGGSVTGAPKVRAMEIIAELEPTARGAYCGSLGYIGLDGSMDTSILIRTITAGRGWWQAPVGGGIVAQSDPRREYEETWHKAEGLVQAMEGEE